MSAFDRCACGGFVLPGRATCPHCGAASGATSGPASARARLGLLGGALGGATLAFTLMACYGIAPCQGGACKETDTAPARDASATPTDGGADSR